MYTPGSICSLLLDNIEINYAVRAHHLVDSFKYRISQHRF